MLADKKCNLTLMYQETVENVWLLLPGLSTSGDAERPGMHSHAERRNDEKKLPDYVEHSAESTKTKQSVIPAGIAGIQCTGTVLMRL